MLAPSLLERRYTEDDIRLAYMGGVFDGEGTIHFAYSKRPARNYARSEVWVALSSTDRRMTDHMRETFGGFVIEVGERSGPPKASALFTWRGSRRLAFVVLKSILPHLRIKREQAELLLAAESTICKLGKRTEEEKQMLIALAEKIRHFNRKGRASRFYVPH